MTDADLSVPAWAVLATLVALVLVVVGLTVALVRSHSRTRAAVAEARADAAGLAEQVAAIERRLDQAARPAKVDEHEYVVTMLGRDDDRVPAEPAPVVPGPLFADLVLRESAVQAASYAAGLRRALAPEVRHRIRWAMKREVKRARKQRKADLRQAKRDFDARERDGLATEENAA
ncbi:hypothetical protein ABFT23_16740 [Nocardioides sp. C4-1]|uniref:hypothetical protein n=1 Tax=Nocardioides sp. C4-1 TaxID=3151851 RepID=UPI0032637D82